MLGVINILLPVSFLEDIVIDLREKDIQNETIKKKKKWNHNVEKGTGGDVTVLKNVKFYI